MERQLRWSGFASDPGHCPLTTAMQPIERALISVYDKRGVVEFARGLSAMGVEILSTGGTARLLASSGVPVTEVSTLTGFPEILDGRVKTLHPRIHGGILAIRENTEHQRQLREHGLRRIDLVCVTLYPFVETTLRPDARFEDIIENIDIGGPSMIRAAAKNFRDVAVVTSPDDYDCVMDALKSGGGVLKPEFLFELARKAFAHTARYDGQIAQYLSEVTAAATGFEKPLGGFPARVFVDFEKLQDLRYGENPHQRASFYRWGGRRPHGLAAMKQLQGKELSYNNIVDLEAAWNLVREFEHPACTIIKHTNPCGTAEADSLPEAFVKAYEADPVSAFGSIVGLNRVVDRPAAEEMAKLFVEAIIAPGYEQGAVDVLGAKKNLRVIDAGTTGSIDGFARFQLKRVTGGLLVQDPDNVAEDTASYRVASVRHPTDAEWRDLLFAWRIAKHVKSNAIVLAAERRSAGVGAGQMSRVDSVRISIEKARPTARGTVLASDAFFPFRDGVDAAAAAGITAIIQPGGSVRDTEVIQAANEHGLAMVFTGIRHFKH